MNDFDKKLKAQAKIENITCPIEVSDAIDNVLNSLPEEAEASYENYKRKTIRWPAIAAIGFAALFLFLFILPNTSPRFVRAMEDVPIIGSIIKVTTIRDYQYDDGNYRVDIKLPSIDMDGNDPSRFINASVEELTNTLLNQFNKDIAEFGDKGYASLDVDYDLVTNSDSWFTLKISVTETAASSNTYYEFYHIDIEKGQLVQLSDLFMDNEDYIYAISENIKSQMLEQMETDSSIVYWLESYKDDMAFHKIEKDQPFYWSETGDLVIVFDEYEVAPGYMGNPEFVIARTVYSEYLKK